MILTAAAASAGGAPDSPDSSACARCWQRFSNAVRDGTRSQPDLARELAAWPQRLRMCFSPAEFQTGVVFPVTGYHMEELGPSAAGYRPGGYRFLDGNRHAGHPAVDIFIRDRDHDCLDDRSAKPVPILAPADGVVMAAERGWHPGGAVGNRRGGNLVWIYHPALGLFSYLAHLGAVEVETGQRVHAGQIVATLGRSGKNAYPARSPTHLHLMFLRADTMAPVDPCSVLSGGLPQNRSLAR